VRVVVHAVSLGELAAARGLLAVLMDAIPGARVTLTVGTAAARAVAPRLVGQSRVDAVQYLPWDRPRAIRSWLSAAEPALVIVLETELWPGLLDACHALKVPVAFVSARVYPQDVARYRLIHGFLAPLLERAALVAAQSPAERDRLLAIGAPRDRTIVTGDLKAIAALEPAPLPDRITSTVNGSFPMMVAGCSHDPEEQWLLEAFTATRRVHPDVRLALAPRAIDRARQVARSAAAAGFAVAATTGAPRGHWDVLVVDEPGVLAGLYGQSAIAVIGGTLVPHGGHSLLEAAAAGIPILCGPHTAHVEAQVARFSDAGALVRADRGSVGETMISLLNDPGRARAIGAAAREVVSELASEAAGVSVHLARLLGARAGGQTAARATV
jgi:3-deoxy-D-manno-octulosonic-acid transferase